MGAMFFHRIWKLLCCLVSLLTLASPASAGDIPIWVNPDMQRIFPSLLNEDWASLEVRQATGKTFEFVNPLGPLDSGMGDIRIQNDVSRLFDRLPGVSRVPELRIVLERARSEASLGWYFFPEAGDDIAAKFVTDVGNLDLPAILLNPNEIKAGYFFEGFSTNPFSAETLLGSNMVHELTHYSQYLDTMAYFESQGLPLELRNELVQAKYMYIGSDEYHAYLNQLRFFGLNEKASSHLARGIVKSGYPDLLSTIEMTRKERADQLLKRLYGNSSDQNSQSRRIISMAPVAAEEASVGYSAADVAWSKSWRNPAAYTLINNKITRGIFLNPVSRFVGRWGGRALGVYGTYQTGADLYEIRQRQSEYNRYNQDRLYTPGDWRFMLQRQMEELSPFR